MDFIKKHIEWAPVIFMVIILSGSLPFKFTGHPQPTHIFNTVGEWLGLELFKTYGAIFIGVVELVASILLLIPKTRVYGAVVALGTMAGAIFFHLFTPLGVTVVWMENGVPQEDGVLFYTAVLVFICAIWLILRRRHELPIIGQTTSVQ
ncbi:DoxX family protein [Kordiimonas sp. SCSIO 12610]|uniref:DoxX family protein n=1 Tax=Kordiimonas sp. SCSIO 12610 TaxID=2829597 RepID=UPI00210AB9A3|nr:DoxX family protein [Kordiimonas sp. SCSIO 12610]UTW55015.1 DoxX family protein [Kordiimonas sp. SCSIO 12610]